MPRKKKPGEAATPAQNTAEPAPAEISAEAIATKPQAGELPAVQVPAPIDEPPQAVADASVDRPADEPANPEAKNWGDPYKAIFRSPEKGFEMGENRRFRQRVFRFAERPSDEVIALLKDNGFTYRASEKSWTIQADAETRKRSDELARELAGPSRGMSR